MNIDFQSGEGFFQFLTMMLVEELVLLFVDEFLPKYAEYRANCLVKLNELSMSSSLLEIEPGEKICQIRVEESIKHSGNLSSQQSP